MPVLWPLDVFSSALLFSKNGPTPALAVRRMAWRKHSSHSAPATVLDAKVGTVHRGAPGTGSNDSVSVRNRCLLCYNHIKPWLCVFFSGECSWTLQFVP